MKFSFRFSNLFGTSYRNGNLLCTPDDNLISPVGNRLTIYDLKNNKSRTLSLESRYNYTTIALSPDGSILIAVNEKGEAQLISMISCTVIHRHKFQTAVQSVVFSPDGAFFAVAKQAAVLVFRAPNATGEYQPFILERQILTGYEDVTCLDWSSDSRFLAIGCRDNTTKISSICYAKNFRNYILSGHTDAIVSAFFEANCLHINTLSRNGQLCLWECSLSLSDLQSFDPKLKQPPNKKKTLDSDGSEDDVANSKEVEPNDKAETVEKLNEFTNKDTKKDTKAHPFFYKKLARHYLADEPRKENRDAVVTTANYNRKTKIMVVAFNTGAFYLYEIPEVNMIHSLSIFDYPISAALFNNTGDWIALASRELGQLLVWEWQSEQYIIKQQGHSSEMTCISYSPDGQYIASGGADAKLKLWNTQSGFCFVTFSEHTSGVTAVQFSKNKKFLVSSSFDGTVRAFDITRYRNFRTFTSPQKVQFSCVALDSSSEFVAAGGQDIFEIYLWSIKLGNLLEVISGHEGPVCSIAFSPVVSSTVLVSGSWDKTIKIWDCLKSNSDHQTIDVLSDATSVAINSSGEHVAVATLNGNITIFDIKTGTQIGLIEGRNDLGSGRSVTDIITAKRNLLGKYFTTIEYSADGECILAAGKSNYICIYHVAEAILLKKYEVTQNHSLDGMDEFINRNNLTEFGNIALITQRDPNENIRTPNVKKNLSARSFTNEMRVHSVKFSPTGQTFAAACTEGLCIYSLENSIVFSPFYLSLDVTPKSIRDALKEEEFHKALIMSLKLNEPNIITLALEKIPFKDIQLICSGLSNEFAHRLLQIISRILQTSLHIEFYLEWCCSLLNTHGHQNAVFEHRTLLALHEIISRKYDLLNKTCDFNKYTMKLMLDAAERQSAANHTEKDDIIN